MTDIPAAEWDWYGSYYSTRVMPKVSSEMEACEGLFRWLGENDPGLYGRISVAEKEIDVLWLSRAEKKTFEAACRAWYGLLLEAKKGMEAWRAREREMVLLVGRQERMAMR
jgi:hypothetical protein